MALLALLALFQAAPQAEAERLFALGNRLYTTGDTTGALAAWEGAAATGWTSAALDHNLGSACLRARRLGCAVLHLERAWEAMPGDDAAAHNLRLAHRLAGEPARGVPPAQRVASEAASVLGRGGLLLGALGLYALAAAVAGVGIWRRWRGRGLRVAATLLVPVALVALVVAAASVSAPARGVVTMPETALRAGPIATADARATLGPGRVVRLGKVRGSWRQARLADGTAGWLPARAVEEI
ncbi:MAG TPA: SH3 domain-containing protein [Rubricoccaceae bacterium]|nr:SH3 domain-containing protein [Rubricoccaceae bacterium]